MDIGLCTVIIIYYIYMKAPKHILKQVSTLKNQYGKKIHTLTSVLFSKMLVYLSTEVVSIIVYVADTILSTEVDVSIYCM